jgi:cell wall-associated NlpC family hydrolase
MRARAVAIAVAGIVTVQLWPNAYAQEKVAIVKEAETKAPKKSSKKRSNGHSGIALKQSSPWQLAPIAAQLSSAPEPEPQLSKKERIKLVLKFARKQLGKPYRYGAVGPDSFDCSGFTMYVWRKGGVSLPHNSGAQRAATKSVPLDKMKPGDLVFSSGHVGMYIGNGKMIHSPHTGRTVSIDPIHSNAYGAGRPLP